MLIKLEKPGRNFGELVSFHFSSFSKRDLYVPKFFTEVLPGADLGMVWFFHQRVSIFWSALQHRGDVRV